MYQTALANIGETAWAYFPERQAKRNPNVKFGFCSNKCNLFVYEVILTAEVDVGTPNYLKWYKHWILLFQGKLARPPCAKDWYDEKVDYFYLIGEGKDGLRKALPGDVITDGTHCGIVAENQQTISATSERVVRNSWGFRGNEDKEVKIFRVIEEEDE